MYPAPARPGFGWKLLQSWWVLISIVGFGCLSGAGFVLIGLRARKPGWWGAGIAYLLIETGLFVAADRVGTGSPGQVDGNVALVWGLLWFACVVHSLVLNVYWLRWREQRYLATQPQPVAYGSPAAVGSPVAYGSPVGPASAVPYSSVPYSGVPYANATSTTPWPAATPWTPNAPAPAYGPVDVNTADAAQLGTLDDFDGGRIAYVLSERQRRGGFTSLAEFAATARLAPHQFERIQRRLTLSPPRRY
jgi:DNA uptake protein ComE-like DNA-binding protein